MDFICTHIISYTIWIATAGFLIGMAVSMTINTIIHKKTLKKIRKINERGGTRYV